MAKILTLSDIASVDGCTLAPFALSGCHQCPSVLEWGKPPKPTKKKWDSWKRCLTRTYLCNHGDILEILGKWKKLKRHMRTRTMYDSETKTLWQEEKKICLEYKPVYQKRAQFKRTFNINTKPTTFAFPVVAHKLNNCILSTSSWAATLSRPEGEESRVGKRTNRGSRF